MGWIADTSAVLQKVMPQLKTFGSGLKRRYPNTTKAVRMTKKQVTNAARPLSDKVENLSKTHVRNNILKTEFRAAAHDSSANKNTWVSEKIKNSSKEQNTKAVQKSKVEKNTRSR